MTTKPSDCWLTPAYFLTLTRQVLGEIDLDPCAPSGAFRKWTGARHYLSVEDNGLSTLNSDLWKGTVFLNPPYSNPAPWIAKLANHYQAGDVSAAIALLKSGAVHNQKSGKPIRRYASAVCFWGAGLSSRLRFESPEGKESNSPNFDVAVVYFGADINTFAKVFGAYGNVMTPYLGDPK